MSASKRFDSTEYLDAWRATKRWPGIHDDLYSMVASEALGDACLDLCCSTGLLGQRLLDTGVVKRACGIDADVSAVMAGQQAGVTLPVLVMKVVPETLTQATHWMREHKVTVLVARRCLPELFGHDHAFGQAFAAAIREQGVREVFLQGRLPTAGAVNSLRSVLDEVALFDHSYRLVRASGQCAYMKAR